VENAIVHGLEPKIEGGTLIIEAQKIDQNIIINVIDTGVGITEIKMNSILKNRSHNSQTENVTSLGINNVHKRIQYYFGSQYGLNINSTIGEGCQVTVTVPFLGEEISPNDYISKYKQEQSYFSDNL
jgi:sensor histidine kinase YesM